jgi:hypothetical protein
MKWLYHEISSGECIKRTGIYEGRLENHYKNIEKIQD